MQPINITVDSQNQRDSILKVAKNLKNADGSPSRVYSKKDVHPAVRKEAARLRRKERREKEKSDNAGMNIVYDWKNRVLLREGVVIVVHSAFLLAPAKKLETREVTQEKTA